MKRVFRRIFAVLVLVLSTAAGVQAIPAARRPSLPAPERAASLLAAAWTWITLHALPTSPARPEKAGCDIDPNGLRCAAPAPAPSDEGCDIDPNGAR